MGVYYGVEAVIGKGERILHTTKEQPLIFDDKVLVALVSNGLYVVAPDVTDPNEYQHFYDTYSQGWWLEMVLYNLPKSEIPNCPDKGRFYMDGLKNISELEKSLKDATPKN